MENRPGTHTKTERYPESVCVELVALEARESKFFEKEAKQLYR